LPFALPFRRRRHLRQTWNCERDLLEVVLDSLDVVIVAFDADGQVTHASRGARELMGTACCAGSGPQAWINHLSPRTPEGLALAPDDLPFVRVLQDKPAPEFDVLVQTARGERLLRASVRPIKDGSGRCLLGAVAVFEDVTK
jgi:PAS domain-containing protein